MADHLLYNHKDIQRYLRKQMSKEEMHAFEKAMMDDPFLSDAIDGYRDSNDNISVEHLAEIERSVKGEKVEAKVIPFVSKQNNWWKIAALFIMIIGSALLVYKMLNTSPNDVSIAAAKEAAQSSTVADTIKAPIETEKPLADLLPSKKLSTPKTASGSPIISNNQNSSIASVQSGKNDEAAQLEMLRKNYQADSVGISMATASAPANASVLEAKGMAMKRESAENIMKPEMSRRSIEARQMFQPNDFKGKVVDEKGQPVAGATIAIRGTNTGTTADANGNFVLRSPDSVVDVVAVGVGRVPNQVTLKSNDPNNKIALRENKELLSEVVITALGNRKNRAQPEGGWERFQEYVDSSAEVASKNPVYTGDVALEFEVDKNGEPYRFRNLNSARKILRDKAIEIIKKGPKWTRNSKSAKGKVTINF